MLSHDAGHRLAISCDGWGGQVGLDEQLELYTLPKRYVSFDWDDKTLKKPRVFDNPPPKVMKVWFQMIILFQIRLWLKVPKCPPFTCVGGLIVDGLNVEFSKQNGCHHLLRFL